MSIILAIDIGNSKIKAGLKDESGAFNRTSFPILGWEDSLVNWLDDQGSTDEIKYSGIMSVGSVATGEIERFLHQIIPQTQLISIQASTSMPLKTDYKTPETLGIDRIVVACGAWADHPNEPILIFDAGTALNWELVSPEGVYLGGGISPGMRMRFRALDEFTAKLPLVEAEGPLVFPGKSTEESIRTGVVLGILGEMESIISRSIETMGENLKVLLTGGDAPFLGIQLKSPNFVDHDLTLKGICAIVSYQNE